MPEEIVQTPEPTEANQQAMDNFAADLFDEPAPEAPETKGAPEDKEPPAKAAAPKADADTGAQDGAEPDAEGAEDEKPPEEADPLDAEIAAIKALGGAWPDALGNEFPINHKGKVRNLTATELYRFANMGFDYNKKMEDYKAQTASLASEQAFLDQAKVIRDMAQGNPMYGQIMTTATQEFSGLIPPGSLKALLEQSGYLAQGQDARGQKPGNDLTEDEILADPKAALAKAREQATRDAMIEFQKYQTALLEQQRHGMQNAEQIQAAAADTARRAAVALAFAELRASEKGFVLDESDAAQYFAESGMKFDLAKGHDKDYWKSVIRQMNTRKVNEGAIGAKALARLLEKERAAKQQKALAKSTVARKAPAGPTGGFAIGPGGTTNAVNAFADELFEK